MCHFLIILIFVFVVLVIFRCNCTYSWKFSDCHTLPDSTNGRVTDSNILCPFVSVGMRFLSVPPSGECVPCQVISVLSGPICWQVLDMFKSSNGRHRINMYGGLTLLVWLVRFSCVRRPVGILYISVDVRST